MSAFGLVLAGGRSRRMGQDKARLRLGGETLLDRTLARARRQVAGLVIVAGDRAENFADSGVPVLTDAIPGSAGPLAGLLAGLDHVAGERPDVSWLASFATDTPFFPPNLVAELLAAASRQNVPIAMARSCGRVHPVFGLWHVSLRADLREALVGEGIRKVDLWTARHGSALVNFPPSAGLDPFFNINTPDDLRRAATFLASAAG